MPVRYLQDSANRAASARIIMHRPHRFMLHSPRPNNAGPLSASPFKTPPRSQVYTFSNPDRVRDPASESWISELLVLVQTECDGQLLVTLHHEMSNGCKCPRMSSDILWSDAESSHVRKSLHQCKTSFVADVFGRPCGVRARSALYRFGPTDQNSAGILPKNLTWHLQCKHVLSVP
ncbi:hypothetical protein BASA60_008175 [Batrachochytrium salamandrivorans]|nr:hypothetical protein BASA60_008175 [Batrachochytrium salamandrivorans]